MKKTALQKNNDGWEKNVIKCYKVKPLIRGFDIITIIVILKIPPEFNIPRGREDFQESNFLSRRTKKEGNRKLFFSAINKKGKIFFSIIRTYGTYSESLIIMK